MDHVLPAVGYRQWVLSFDGRLAVRLGYDEELLARVAVAVTLCRKCGGRMGVVAVVNDLDDIARILHGGRDMPERSCPFGHGHGGAGAARGGGLVCSSRASASRSCWRPSATPG